MTHRRITESTVTKYRDWLKRFERWLATNHVPLDLGVIDDDVIAHLQDTLLREIDDGDLKDSSASTYARCIKTFFTQTWARLGLEPSTNPTLRMHPGSQTAGEFPLLTPQQVKSLMAATMRGLGRLVEPWIAHRDRTLLATFFDLGWRAKEAANATLDDIDLRGRYVTIRKENVKVFRGRVVGVNPDLARLLKAWLALRRDVTPQDTDRGRYLASRDRGDADRPQRPCRTDRTGSATVRSRCGGRSRPRSQRAVRQAAETSFLAVLVSRGNNGRTR